MIVLKIINFGPIPASSYSHIIFQKIIKNIQKKIIISFTSYPKRFNLIPTVLKSLYEQAFPINTLNMVLELTLFWSNHRCNILKYM